MSQPTNQGDSNPAEMAQQILSALTKKRETKWPEWDGMAQNLRSFLFELRVKIEEDRNLLGTDRAVCSGMLGTLSYEKKFQVDS